ncbi:hypothetical protein EV714DRAFT_272142 [Schizophyllum commune]
MRRIASVFHKRDRDSQSSATASTAGRSSTNLSIIKPKKSFRRTQSQTLTVVPPTHHAPPPVPSVTPALLSDPTHSSASSSGGSSFLHTPEDELLIFPPAVVAADTTPRRKSWMPWLNKRHELGRPQKPDAPDHHPGARLLPPPARNRPAMQDEDSDDDTSSESEDEHSDADVVTRRSPPTTPTRAFTPASATAALDYLTAITQRKQDGKTCPLSPFVLDSTSLPFPRSTARAPARSHATLRTRMHRQHILARINSSGRRLSRAEEASILPYSSRPTVSYTPGEDQDEFLERRPPRNARVLPYSPGIRRWIARPMFEERHAVYVANGSSIATYGVSCAWAVAALEYSEVLDEMAGYDLVADEAPSPDVGPSASESATVTGSPASTSSTGSSSTHLHVPKRNSAHGKPPSPLPPSPLRNETDTAAAQPFSMPEPPTPTPVARSSPPRLPEIKVEANSPVAAAAPSPKRGVHFAEEDKKDDVVPLGYVLRARQRKAEKAKFLREEQEKRKAEIERARLEAERLQREKERAEWERERAAWEKEKRAIEEERKKRLYQQEVVAARQRRESQRFGHGMAPSASAGSLRESESPQRDSKRYSRPAYDNSGRQGSDSGNSRPASIAPATSTSSPRPVSIHSRPGSTYSAASEDMRPRMRERSSTAPQPERASSFPVYGGSTSSLHMTPPMPQMPTGMMPMVPGMMTPNMPMMGMPMMNMGMPMGMPYAMDCNMPLLPPSAPFMMQSTRSRSRGSSRDSSPTSSPGSSSPARSRERLASSSSRPPSTVGSSSQWTPSHERRGSDDRSVNSRTSRHTAGTTQTASLSRGRAKHPNPAPPIPSPWTALPMQQPSVVPMTMPVSGRQQKPHTNRRSTAFT